MFDIMYIIFLIWFVLASILVWYFLIGMIVSEIRSLCYYNKLTKKSSKKISGQSGKEKLTRKHLKMLNKYCKLVKAYENDPLFRFDVACMQKYKPGGIFGPLSHTKRFALREKQYGESIERPNFVEMTYDSIQISSKLEDKTNKKETSDSFKEFIRLCRSGHNLSVLVESFVAKCAEHDSELKKKYEDFKTSPDYVPPEERLKRPGVFIDVQRPSFNEDSKNEIKRAVKIIDSPEFKKDEAQT